MEIFELLGALVQLCGCLLEVTAVGSTAGAGVAGYQAKKTSKERKAAIAQGEEPPANPYWLWFVVLVFIAVFAVGLLFFKYGVARNG